MKTAMNLLLRGTTFLLGLVLWIGPTQQLAISQEECVVISGEMTPGEKHIFENPRMFSPTATRHVNLAVHVVRYTNGTGGISQGDITTSIQQLNTAFTTAMINFMVTSTDYINNDTYTTIDDLNEVYGLWGLGYNQQNVLNVYFVLDAYFNGIAERPGRKLIVRNPVATNGSTFAHEVGHNLTMYHTHGAGTQELVNGSNCTNAGDYICDTPAEPYNNGSGILGSVNGSCQYTGTFRDPNNELFNPDTYNFMGYSLASCRNHFSTQQIDVMNGYLSTATDLLSVSVAVSNEVNGSTHSGSTLTINSQVITSPGSITLLDGNTYPGKTNHERLSGDNKHKDWNAVASEFTLSKDFTVDRTTEIGRTRKARFTSLTAATITAQLIETGSSGGNVQFRDPWYLADASGNQPNQFYTYTAPFSPTGAYNQSTGGVFTGQLVVGGNPYYSVGAPNPNYINGFESYFQNWEGSNVSFQYATSDQSGVVFTASGATATAKYKAHLGSSMSNATASNSQRLMASRDNSWFSMVYPRAGELWWSSTTDAGATWWDDYRFTNSSGTASAPSLALWTDCVTLDAADQSICNTDPYVVYRTQSGSDYNIKFCILNTGTPYPIPTSTQLNAVAIPTSIDTRPVVARLYDYGSDELWAFWQGATSLNYNYAYKSGSTWSWMGEQAFLNGFKNPSLSAPDLTVATPNWYLTYDNGNDVYILTYPDYTLDGAVPASVGPTSFASQVSADNRTGEQVHVVWEAFGEYVDPPSTDGGTGWKGNGAGVQRHRVMYQKWNGTGLGWGAAYEFRSSTLSYYRPTVSNLANGHVAWAWDDGSTTYKALYSGTSWSVTETFANTTRPNLGTSGSAGMINSPRFVSTSTTGPPYRLNVGAAASRPDGDSQTSVAPGQYSRKVIVARNPSHRAGRLLHQVAKDGLTQIDSSTYLSVELAPIMLKLRDGSTIAVDFPSATDSTMDERSVWSSLASTPVMLTSAIDSVFINGSTEAYAPLRLAGRELGLAFDVVDAEEGTVLRRIGTERVFNADSVSSFALRGHLAGLAGRRVFLRPSIRGFEMERRNLVSTLVHVYTLLDESATKPSVSLAKSSDSPVLMPTTFALHPNYPNPFNPTTEIRFDLPDAGNVSLVVYDVLGRQVADLATGYQEAGYHSAIWNAGSVASGVYFARFNVVNAEGKVAYSKINKLMLIR